jgi:hypothetical protein
MKGHREEVEKVGRWEAMEVGIRNGECGMKQREAEG